MVFIRFLGQGATLRIFPSMLATQKFVTVSSIALRDSTRSVI